MKRRELLSGLVPVVAGAASVRQSSAANMLTGGVSSIEGRSFTAKEVVWLLLVQWFTTFSANSEFFKVPPVFKKAGKDDECMKNGILHSRVVKIQLAEAYVDSGHGPTKCIGWLADTAIIEYIRYSITSHVAAVLNSIEVPRIRTTDQSALREKITQEKPVEYHVDVEGDQEIDFRRYYVSVDDKIPMSLDVALESLAWRGDFEDQSFSLRIDVKIAVDKHVGKITCLEGCWIGVPRHKS